jgi:hypothetical protein
MVGQQAWYGQAFSSVQVLGITVGPGVTTTVGSWYRVVKTIKGHRYLYEQRTWREGKRVRTENRYLGPVDGRSGNSTPREIEPLAWEARKYESAEEFKRSLREGITVPIERMPDNVRWLQAAVDEARASGTIADIQKAEKELRDALTDLNRVVRTKTPFLYILHQECIKVTGRDVADISSSDEYIPKVAYPFESG